MLSNNDSYHNWCPGWVLVCGIPENSCSNGTSRGTQQNNDSTIYIPSKGILQKVPSMLRYGKSNSIIVNVNSFDWNKLSTARIDFGGIGRLHFNLDQNENAVCSNSLNDIAGKRTDIRISQNRRRDVRMLEHPVVISESYVGESRKIPMPALLALAHSKGSMDPSRANIIHLCVRGWNVFVLLEFARRIDMPSVQANRRRNLLQRNVGVVERVLALFNDCVLACMSVRLKFEIIVSLGPTLRRIWRP